MSDEYLVRFVQCNETFRLPELEALGKQEDVKISVIDYREHSPFCIVKFESTETKSSESPSPSGAVEHDSLTTDAVARSFIKRSVLSKAIFHVWGSGTDYESLHADVKSRSAHLWPQYLHTSFKFSIDAFYSKRSASQQKQIINSFSYLGFQGKPAMKNPEVEFVVLEEWEFDQYPEVSLEQQRQRQKPPQENGDAGADTPRRQPVRIFLGRLVGESRRTLIEKHDLKKRPYISTTSMDAELALVTANLALAGPGKLFLDPFVGTGGFMVAASELGAVTLGSDIDGRSFRGKGTGLQKGVGANFERYRLRSLFGDCFTSDLTNTPFRRCGSRNATGEGQKLRRRGERWLDGIISDPPYGVREGLKVLGLRGGRPSRAVGSRVPGVSSEESIGGAATMVESGHNDNQQHRLTVNGATTSTEMHTDAKSAAASISLTPSTEANSSSTSISNPVPTSDSLSTATPSLERTIQQNTPLAASPPLIDNVPAHLLPGYIAPKKPYSFALMLQDILDFAASTLVDGGRLGFWMPIANPIDNDDESPSIGTSSDSTTKEAKSNLGTETESKENESEVDPTIAMIPSHPQLRLIHVCTQNFNRWSRRLLIYERMADADSDTGHGHGNDNDDNDDNGYTTTTTGSNTKLNNNAAASSSSASSRRTVLKNGENNEIAVGTGVRTTVDDLNPFRKMYFRGFQRE